MSTSDFEPTIPTFTDRPIPPEQLGLPVVCITPDLEGSMVNHTAYRVNGLLPQQLKNTGEQKHINDKAHHRWHHRENDHDD